MLLRDDVSDLRREKEIQDGDCQKDQDDVGNEYLQETQNLSLGTLFNGIAEDGLAVAARRALFLLLPAR